MLGTKYRLHEMMRHKQDQQMGLPMKYLVFVLFLIEWVSNLIIKW